MENKKQFIQDLSDVFTKYTYNTSVEKMEYFRPGKIYDEEVVITFDGGWTRTVNVSWDSINAMVRDIVKQGLYDI